MFDVDFLSFSINYNYIHVNGNYMTIYAANMMDKESFSIRKGSIKSVRAYNLTFQILRIKTWKLDKTEQEKGKQQ